MTRKDKDRLMKIYLMLEDAMDLLHDMATDDPCNKDWRRGRLAAA